MQAAAAAAHILVIPQELLDRVAAARGLIATLLARLEQLTRAAALVAAGIFRRALTAARVDLALSSCLFRPPSILAPQPAPRRFSLAL